MVDPRKYATDPNYRKIEDDNAGQIFEYYVKNQIDVEKELEDTLYYKEKVPTESSVIERVMLATMKTQPSASVANKEFSSSSSPHRQAPTSSRFTFQKKYEPLVLNIPANHNLSFADKRLMRQVAEYNSTKLMLSRRKEHKIDESLLKKTSKRIDFVSDNFDGLKSSLFQSLGKEQSQKTIPQPIKSFRTTFHDNLRHLEVEAAMSKKKSFLQTQALQEQLRIKVAFEQATKAANKKLPLLKISSSLDYEGMTRVKTDFSDSEENRKHKKMPARKMTKFIEQLHASPSGNSREVGNSSHFATNATEYINLDKSRPSKDIDFLEVRSKHLEFLTPRSQHSPTDFNTSPDLKQSQPVEGRQRKADGFAAPTRAFQIKKKSQPQNTSD